MNFLVLFCERPQRFTFVELAIYWLVFITAKSHTHKRTLKLMQFKLLQYDLKTFK